MKNRKLVLENGACFEGFGEELPDQIGEVVFNTSMVGYQEILTDPSYYDQIVVLTYPLIGNYGWNSEDNESDNIHVKGLIVSEYNKTPSNFRSTQALHEALEESNVGMITGIDTRELTKVIRDEGSMLGLMTNISTPHETCMALLKSHTKTFKHTQFVTNKKSKMYKTTKPKYHVAVIDFGTKKNIIRQLNKRGCNVTVLPFDVKVETLKKLQLDGILFSNGPGNPEDNVEGIALIQSLKGQIPIMGICLGHQLIGLAYGAKTYKLKFGHRGSNHPVKNLMTGKIEMTSQNHSYAITECSLKDTALVMTHLNLLDQTVEGMKDETHAVFSTQYHPESAAGPEDSHYLFDDFMTLMQQFKERRHA